MDTAAAFSMNASRRGRWFKDVVMALLLASALAMIATAVSGDSCFRFSELPHLVTDTLRRSFTGAI
jgi:hypothetical protein